MDLRLTPQEKELAKKLAKDKGLPSAAALICHLLAEEKKRAFPRAGLKATPQPEAQATASQKPRQRKRVA